MYLQTSEFHQLKTGGKIGWNSDCAQEPPVVYITSDVPSIFLLVVLDKLIGGDIVKRFGGIRRNTRSKYKKNYRQKGKLSIANFIQELNVGDRVSLFIESSYQKGMYHPRFFGKVGEVKAKVGSCYHVKINDLGKDKTLLVHPVHLKKLR